MLTLAGIQAGYSGMQVLFGIDIQVDEGEVVAILGAKGAGKSTILRVITGLLHPTAGTMTLRGDPIHHLLENGRVVLQGAARELVGNDYVRKTYLAA